MTTTAAPPQIARRLFTVAEYTAMAEAGVLHECETNFPIGQEHRGLPPGGSTSLDCGITLQNELQVGFANFPSRPAFITGGQVQYDILTVAASISYRNRTVLHAKGMSWHKSLKPIAVNFFDDDGIVSHRAYFHFAGLKFDAQVARLVIPELWRSFNLHSEPPVLNAELIPHSCGVNILLQAHG